MIYRIVCVECGGDRTDDSPESSCQTEVDWLDICGNHHTGECGKTDVRCVPNSLSWAALKMLEVLEGMVYYLGDDAAWLTEPAYEEMVAAIAAAKGERAERGT